MDAGQYVGGYRLIERRGVGGAGTVWLATDDGGMPVALKLLHPALAADQVARERLIRETRTVNAVDSPGVAHVLDVEVDDVQPFIVSEFVEGPTLAEVLSSGPLSQGEALRCAQQLFDIVQAVHAAGVIHRDIKPGNVIMSSGGPVLIDFGIAQGEEDLTLTAHGFVSGTASYASPEILRGSRPNEEADWWAWVATVLHTLTGRPPFGPGSTEAVMNRVLAGAPDVAGLPWGVAQVFRHALHPDASQRMSGPELLDMLSVPDTWVAPEGSQDAQATTVLPSANVPTYPLAPSYPPGRPLVSPGTSAPAAWEATTALPEVPALSEWDGSALSEWDGSTPEPSAPDATTPRFAESAFPVSDAPRVTSPNTGSSVDFPPTAPLPTPGHLPPTAPLPTPGPAQGNTEAANGWPSNSGYVPGNVGSGPGNAVYGLGNSGYGPGGTGYGPAWPADVAQDASELEVSAFSFAAPPSTPLVVLSILAALGLLPIFMGGAGVVWLVGALLLVGCIGGISRSVRTRRLAAMGVRRSDWWVALVRSPLTILRVIATFLVGLIASASIAGVLAFLAANIAPQWVDDAIYVTYDQIPHTLFYSQASPAIAEVTTNVWVALGMYGFVLLTLVLIWAFPSGRDINEGIALPVRTLLAPAWARALLVMMILSAVGISWWLPVKSLVFWT